MIGNILQPTSSVVTGTKGVITGTTTFTGAFAVSAGNTIAVGTGTLFKKELQRGDWLYSTTTNEVRKIMVIYGDFTIGFNKPFSSAITADNVIVARRSQARSIVIRDIGSATSIVNGNISFANGYSLALNNSEAGIEPLVYDTLTNAGASLSLTVSY